MTLESCENNVRISETYFTKGSWHDSASLVKTMLLLGNSDPSGHNFTYVTTVETFCRKYRLSSQIKCVTTHKQFLETNLMMLQAQMHPQIAFQKLVLSGVVIIRPEYDIDGLGQDCSISSALAMEILQSCTMPSILCMPLPEQMQHIEPNFIYSYDCIVDFSWVFHYV